jgi:hypothetical protein
MAVSPGVAAGFAADMEDNGNPIDLPEGSSFAWVTDDSNDIISVSLDTTSAKITVPADTDPARTELVVTVQAADPNGKMISGSVSVPITAGVEHTYTISVAQVVLNPNRRRAA